eukprot:9548046-Ditylum_brightwellii.AAC.1
MVYPCDCVGPDETVLFYGVDDSVDGADKHLTHLSQWVDCHLMERSKQNKHVVGNKDNGVDNGMVLAMVLTIVLTIVMTVPISNSHISHKRLIVV